jgi:hypothetical protein
VIGACLHKSFLWAPHVRKFRLHTNMRAQLATDPTVAHQAQSWADLLMHIGNGTVPVVPEVHDLLTILPSHPEMQASLTHSLTHSHPLIIAPIACSWART